MFYIFHFLHTIYSDGQKSLAHFFYNFLWRPHEEGGNFLRLNLFYKSNDYVPIPSGWRE